MTPRNETTVQLGFAAILFAMANQISQPAAGISVNDVYKEKKPGPLHELLQFITPLAASFLKSMVPAEDPFNAEKVSLKGLGNDTDDLNLGMLPAHLMEVEEALGKDNPISLVEIMSALAKSLQQRNPTIIKHKVEEAFNHIKYQA